MSSKNEILAKKREALRDTLNIAALCLKNFDYLNGHVVYGDALQGLNNEILNESELFSVQFCYALCCILSKMEILREKGETVLDNLNENITLPAVPFLKANNFVIKKNFFLASANLKDTKKMLKDGWNFKQNLILNELVVPLLRPEILMAEVEKLTQICEIATSKLIKSNPSIPNAIEAKRGEPDQREAPKKFFNPTKSFGTQMDRKYASVGIQVKPVKVNRKIQTENINNFHSVCTQTVPKVQCAEIQTDEVRTDKIVLEINNQVKNLMKQVNKEKIKDLNDKLKDRDREIIFLKEQLKKSDLRLENEKETNNTAMNCLREQMDKMSGNLERKDNMQSIMQKVLVEQTQKEYHMQKDLYGMFEDKCAFKVQYFTNIQKYLTNDSVLSLFDCKQEVKFWRRIKATVSEAKDKFESHFKTIQNNLLEQNYQTINCYWPAMPSIPIDDQDLIYMNFRKIVSEKDLHKFFRNLPVQAGSPSQVFSSDRSLFVYLQSRLIDINETDWVNTFIELREKNGGTLIGLNKETLVRDIRRIVQENENKCCICLEDILPNNNFALSNCRHEFHKICIREWMQKQKDCPVCRMTTSAIDAAQVK